MPSLAALDPTEVWMRPALQIRAHPSDLPSPRAGDFAEQDGSMHGWRSARAHGRAIANSANFDQVEAHSRSRARAVDPVLHCPVGDHWDPATTSHLTRSNPRSTTPGVSAAR